MTKEEYLKYRNIPNNEIVIVYEYYKQNFNSTKHSPFLSETEFFIHIMNWCDFNTLVYNILSYFDIKFKIMKIIDLNTNRIIKFI